MPSILDTTLSAGARAIDDLPRGHLVGGVFRDRGAGRAAVRNPATETVLCDVADGTAADVDAAVAAATAAGPRWRRTPPAGRAAVLSDLAAVIEDHADLLAAVESLNTGKPIRLSGMEMPAAADVLRFMAGAARTAQAPAPDQYVEGHLSLIRREPVGVVAAIMPWNYPLMNAIWKIAPALAAGNTVVVKPSELTPLTTLLLGRLAADVLPPGVLNVVVGTGPVVGGALAAHPDVAMVTLTGGVASGRAVARVAADTVKRVHLELGGKAPVLVFDDAELDVAVATVLEAGYWNSGQDCGAATRVLCHSAVHDRFVEKLVAAGSGLALGDPADGEHVELGPLISRHHLDRVDGMVRQGIADGATVALGGAPVDRRGHFYPPTVLTDLPPGCALTREEVFGPVVTVETFSSEDEAVALANAVEYGLAASVWTENGGRALRVSEALDFGTVWVNSHLLTPSEMPWGGFGSSGYGRDLSTCGLDDYARTKHVTFSAGRAGAGPGGGAGSAEHPGA